MKGKRLSVIVLSILVLSFSPVVSLATKGEEAQIEKESVEISSKIDQALDSVNVKYREVETLKTEVSKMEKKITDTQDDIQKTEASIDKRTEVMGTRMQNIQANGSSLDFVDALLDAESMSDFINRAYAMTVLQGAEKSKVTSLAEDKEKLEGLKVELEENKTTLSEKQNTMSEEAASLEQGVASLKTELSNNQDALDKLANTRMAQEAQAKKAAAEEANRKEMDKQIQAKAEKEAEVTNESSSATAESQTENTSTPAEPENVVEPTPAPITPDTSTGGGKVLTMEATAYSYTQPGLTFHTATGIDLRQNSRVVAVDPNTISLGSLVEVSGYGFAVAGDTGGDIKGNRLDVHFNTIQECTNWGRRTVTVTVL